MTNTKSGSTGFDLDKIPAWASIAVAAALWAVVFAPLLSFSVSDFRGFVKPWLDFIRANGGFAALAHGFSEYAPPYLYLLAALSYFDFPFNDQVLIKLINAPFVLTVAVTTFLLCRHFGKSRNFAIAAAASTFLLPTLNVNAFVWGQADALYASLLLLTVLLVLKRRPYWAVALFAAALSIKPQPMMLAPFMLAMVFAGLIPWRAGFVAPAVYIASILPAFLIGRPLPELLQIYLVQGDFYHRLSFNAANFYFPLELLFDDRSSRLFYKIGTVFGLLLSLATGVLIALAAVGRRAMSDRAILILAALTVTVMPFVLPKMHDRYFIVADVFLFALAWVDRRFLWAALAMQVSSGLAYAPEFSIYILPGDPADWAWGVIAGAAINAGVIAYLVRQMHAELSPLWDVAAIRRCVPLAGAKAT